RALTSRVSNATVSCSGRAPALGADLWDSVFMDCNGLRKLWIADRKHRELFQLPGEEEEPQTTEGQRRSKIPDGRQGGRRKFRPRVPEEIDQTHKNQPNGHAAQEGGVALQIAGQQQEKGHEEMENEDDNRDH